MNGLIYIAVGTPYVNSAIMSAASARRFHDNPILIITDKDSAVWPRAKAEFDIDVQVIETGYPDNTHRSSRFLKTQVFKFSPFTRSVFLDADTFVCKSISALWLAPTDDKPIAMPLSQSQPKVKDIANDKKLMKKLTYKHDFELTLKVAGANAPHFCSSTMAWLKRKDVDDLADRWYREWQRFESRDMMALARAISLSGVHIETLPGKYSHRHILDKTTVVHTAWLRRMRKVHMKHQKLLKRVQAILER